MATSRPLVLIVDDEPRLRDILRRILETKGYKVITATDGETAIRLVKANKTDLILLDLMMPGIDGRKVCRRVREFSLETKVIYLTAKARSAPLASKELSSEADAFITKPATSRQILSVVSRVLSGA